GRCPPRRRFWRAGCAVLHVPGRYRRPCTGSRRGHDERCKRNGGRRMMAPPATCILDTHEPDTTDPDLSDIRAMQVRIGYESQRHQARQTHVTEMDSVGAANKPDPKGVSLLTPGTLRRRPASARRSGASRSRRRGDTPGKLVPPRPRNEYVDRRGTSLLQK